MKDQYSSTYDDPIVANERLRNKLDFLQRESIKRQNYLKDLEKNFKLAKQTISSLTEKNPPREQVIAQLHQENTSLTDKLKAEHNSICRLNALYLMECQLRIQQAKSFNERIKDFEENMAELRRYLHDKEESFSFVAEKLKRFEELLPNQQITMYEKLVNYSAIVKEEIRWKDVFGEVMEDRDQWKKQAEQAKEKCSRLEILLNALKSQPGFEKFQKFVKNLAQDQVYKTHTAIILNSNNLSLPQPELKPTFNQSTNQTYSEPNKLPLEPNVELIRLMKKQKLNNKILEAALTDAIDKNLELIQYNQKLIESNQNLRQEVDYMIADMAVLCKVLKKYDENYRTRIDIIKVRNKAKCDLDLPSYRQILDKYKKNSIEEAKQILFTKMRQDVEELTQYIALCPLQKTNNIRSFQSPRKPYEDSQNLDISMNEKELSISQI